MHTLSKAVILLALSLMSAAVVADDPVTIRIYVIAGAAGMGHLKWIARTLDPGFDRCGHREMHGVENDALVYVSVNSGCRRITR